ncbi:Mov34/MPN/PAD-1 family protein [Desulfovibrio sp. DV]|uniref:Mov34/MPN/PAD-1 family protein n=1 Tax=Desulfovibrio sp. DV TaxID=1844708 RepID=UPI0009FB196A|nr:Mov34/MPN/PAD-1 family protein [Desulfovibrio sp. DV]
MSVMQRTKLIYPMLHCGRLNISEEVTNKLFPWRQLNSLDREAGGLLLGRHLIDSPNIIIDDITAPLECDKRSRFSFFRSLSHNLIAKGQWLSSGKTCITLGTWHSHPEVYPEPSLQDWNDWKKVLRKGRYPSPFLFFLILGIESVRVWQGFNPEKIFEIKCNI